MTDLPFAGLRVLDHTWYAAGPLATKVLADYGAEVIKIETEHRSEPLREPNLRQDGVLSRNVSLYNIFNSSKRSITLNMRHPKGAELLRRLIEISDVMVDNFVPDMMGRWGFPYDEVLEHNPRMIVVNMPFIGRTEGPYRNLMGFGRSMLAMTGFNAAMGFPGDPPIGTNNDYPDLGINAYHGALAILAALHFRNRTGQGQFVEVSQYESTVAALETTLMRVLANGEQVGPAGNRVSYAAPHGVFRCKGEDRWCTIAVRSDEEWESFCDALGRPEWRRDERFRTLAQRKRNEDELEREVEAWTRERTPEEVMFILQRCRIPAGVAQNAHDLLVRDPNIESRGHYVRLPHDEDGLRIYDGLQAHLSLTPGRLASAAPLLGEANEYVFRQLLGLSEEEMNQGYVDGVFS